jgi:hypothetical protein
MRTRLELLQTGLNTGGAVQLRMSANDDLTWDAPGGSVCNVPRFIVM